MKELWVGEYSASQDAFHSQPLTEALSANRQRALRKDANDWVALVVGKQEAVRRVVEMIRDGQGQLLSLRE